MYCIKSTQTHGRYPQSHICTQPNARTNNIQTFTFTNPTSTYGNVCTMCIKQHYWIYVSSARYMYIYHTHHTTHTPLCSLQTSITCIHYFILRRQDKTIQMCVWSLRGARIHKYSPYTVTDPERGIPLLPLCQVWFI